MKHALLVSAALLASCLQAGAITLTVEQDGVRLNRGKGYQPVRGTVAANVGDLVKLDAKGRATLITQCGVVELKPGLTRVVEPPCAPPAASAQTSPEASASPQINPLYVLGGLAAVGGVVGGVVAATSNNGGSAPAAAFMAQNNVSR